MSFMDPRSGLNLQNVSLGTLNKAWKKVIHKLHSNELQRLSQQSMFTCHLLLFSTSPRFDRFDSLD